MYYTGSIRDGVLNGDIVVVASGDPSINTTHSPGSKDLAAEVTAWLKQKGVSSVRGRLVIDESKFPGPAINPTWKSGDLPHAYGTGTHGFNFEDNANKGKSVKNPGAVFKTRLIAAMKRDGISLLEESVEEVRGLC